MKQIFSFKLSKLLLLITVFFTTLFSLLIFDVANAEECGSIIIPEEFYDEVITEPIEDCDNPFEAESEGSPAEVFIDDELLGVGTNIEVSQNEWKTFDIATDDHFAYLYKQTVDGYELVGELGEGSHLIAYDQELFLSLEEKFYFDVKNENTNWSLILRENSSIIYGPPRNHEALELIAEYEQSYLKRSYILDKGNYFMVFEEFDNGGPVLSFVNEIKNFFIRTAQAQFSEPIISHVLPFTINGGEVFSPLEPEEEIDPLLLEYAPILYMHPDETYFPMNIEAFVEGSALWDRSGTDEQVLNEEDLTMEEFESIVASGIDTEDHYLAYSDPDNSKSIDLEAARTKYLNARDSGLATTTVYVHKMEDSFVDDNGVLQEYIVLQYWFFYAMNNWQEVGGRNNHEGDWESVFIFLDKNTEEPKFVAYSAHLNDGEAERLNPFQYDSVRRSWISEDVTRDEGQVIGFVSWGSHANYPNNGMGGKHIVSRKNNDLTSAEGDRVYIASSKMLNLNINKAWFDYRGYWGADSISIGGDGPQGPRFIDLTGQVRFVEPIEWAGIDNITEVVVEENTSEISAQGVEFNFSEPLDADTALSVDKHEELITFGDRPEGVTLLPTFWDFESSLENDTFLVDVSLPYIDEVLEGYETEPESLNVYFFDEESDYWLPQPTNVDDVENTAQFTTTHFSRYALGFTTETEMTIEELFTELKQEIKASDLRRVPKYILKNYVKLIERFVERDSKSSKRVAKRLLKNLERKITVYERWYGVELEEVKTLVLEIRDKI